MIVVDSSVWVDWFRNATTPQTGLLAVVVADDAVLMGDLILMEVLQGCRGDGDWLRTKVALDALPCEPMVGKDIALLAASNYRKLRTIGVTPRKTIDVLIATFCIENGHHLLHADRDFDAMEKHLGLRVV